MVPWGSVGVILEHRPRKKHSEMWLQSHQEKKVGDEKPLTSSTAWLTSGLVEKYLRILLWKGARAGVPPSPIVPSMWSVQLSWSNSLFTLSQNLGRLGAVGTVKGKTTWSLFICLLFCLGATPGRTQGLHLVLHSGNTPGGLGRLSGTLRIISGSAVCKTSTLPCVLPAVLSLQPLKLELWNQAL